MSEQSKRDPRREPPLGRAQLQRHQFDVDATQDVPEKLRRIDLLLDPPPFQHNALERASLRSSLRDDPMIPSRPQWVQGSTRPRRATLSERPPAKLRHHGVEVEPLIIFNSDDRRFYNDTRYPWGCVCRIVTASGMGSGVIVGPRHVLTASHVVDWSRDGAGSVEVHRAGGATSAISAITRAWYYTKINPPSVGWSDVDEDYAVLVTADRIGDRFGWMGVRTYDSTWDDEPYWWNIGYASDLFGQQFPLFQNQRELDEDEWDWGSARSMTTTADTVKGQSGSPLFGFWADGPYVVAVVSAEGTYFLSGDENWCAGGSDLTRLVTHARNTDP